MNIFYLDRDPAKAAKDQCDKHVVKMVLESTQILCTVLQQKGIIIPGGYAPTHQNHPSVVWAGKAAKNFYWLITHALNLDMEYMFRYNRKHACHDILCTIAAYYNNQSFDKTLSWPETDFTHPPQCMPDQYKNKSTVKAYRAYYKGEKARFAKWAYCPQPKWWK